MTSLFETNKIVNKLLGNFTKRGDTYHYSYAINCSITSIHFFTQVFQLEYVNVMFCCENKQRIVPNIIWLILDPTQHADLVE